MIRSAVVVTYHAIETGPPPLCLDPGLFRAHVDSLLELGTTSVTITELATALRSDELPSRAVAITFDDGCASAVRVAAPMLAERGLTATLFCVAGYLGKANRWPSQPRSVPTLDLATASELAELAACGFEIGSHGLDHAPLADASADLARRELRDSKATLEDEVGVSVSSFAYPYGVLPNADGKALANELYVAACAGGTARVLATSDPLMLPRVDAQYVRRPAILRRVVTGSLDPYLRARALSARARRTLRDDYVHDGG
jgi:peptidoglycan/xylan/chitin deacetylase (PgdA/CDA1 family)